MELQVLSSTQTRRILISACSREWDSPLRAMIAGAAIHSKRDILAASSNNTIYADADNDKEGDNMKANQITRHLLDLESRRPDNTDDCFVKLMCKSDDHIVSCAVPPDVPDSKHTLPNFKLSSVDGNEDQEGPLHYGHNRPVELHSAYRRNAGRRLLDHDVFPALDFQLQVGEP